MCAVYEEETLTEKALLKHLVEHGAHGKKVAKAEKKVAVSKEAVVSSARDAFEEAAFFFKRISGMGFLLFKVTAKVLSPAPHRHTHPHVGGSPSLTGDGALRCVCAVADGRLAQPRRRGEAVRPQCVRVPAVRHRWLRGAQDSGVSHMPTCLPPHSLSHMPTTSTC